MKNRAIKLGALSLALAFPVSQPLLAHKLIAQSQVVDVAKSDVVVVPGRDWNRLSGSIGKNVERWTLDGQQLNEVTFYGGILPGNPLVKERSKKHEPLPKFTAQTLLIEIPELLEGTYRPYRSLTAFDTVSVEPVQFLGNDGVSFEYRYDDNDGLRRRGVAQAAIVSGRLYMMTYDAPRLHYFDKNLGDFLALVAAAKFG